MTSYPNDLDTDLEIPRVENNITEIGGDVINALRDAIFVIESVLGINPQGSSSVADRLNAITLPDGTIKPSALTGIGLISLPITGNMISNQSVPESKLSLNYSTSSLYALYQALNSANNNLSNYYVDLNNSFNNHVDGYAQIGNISGYLRHVASHIDINDGYDNGSSEHYVGIDKRDLHFTNPGLFDIDGDIRQAKTIMDALLQINNDLIGHINSANRTHVGDFISLNVSNFQTIPQTINNVQKAFEYFDKTQTLVLTNHNGDMHSAGITRTNSNTELLNMDGYNYYFGPFNCITSNNNIVTLSNPGNNSLDWAFSQLVAGDVAKINYGGFEIEFPIEKITYVQNTTYSVTLDGYNIIETDKANIIFEKSKFDDNHFGKLAVCPAAHNYYQYEDAQEVPYIIKDLYLNNLPSSSIVVPPNAPMVCGLDLALQDIDSTHYMLYLAFYPTGNPKLAAINPPVELKGIDVSGNKGTTPGSYTLTKIIDETNKQFRSAGYNDRFVAFECKGQFGIAIADTINNPGFSIISSLNGTDIGNLANNIIDISSFKDALGFGVLKANIASPIYNESNIIPTKVFVGRKNRMYNVGGQYIDYLADSYLLNDGFIGANLVKTDTIHKEYPLISRCVGYYTISKNLTNTKLLPGSTIVVVPQNNATTYDNNYGRFIVESVDYTCDGYNTIKVVDCLSMRGKPASLTITPKEDDPTTWLPVKIHICDDSVNYPTNNETKSYFETYITKQGNTFAHKRAEMPLQDTINNSNLLNTKMEAGVLLDNGVYKYVNYGWHIVDVSPKLRGYKSKLNLSSNERFVRLVISNINGNTFDGYICQPDVLPRIPNKGATVKFAFNKPTRLYDNTGIDYIEIMFDVNPNNISTLSDITPGYVDIKIFDTLRTNDQYMCLSSCEQFNGTRGAILTRFKDLRQFGTVDEKILSTSAIKFIESGDRLLHHNGVISGFENIATGTSLIIGRTFSTNVWKSTDKHCSFNGGVAIINGKIVNKNNFNTPIHNAYIAGGQSSINYMVCLKEDGSVENILFDPNCYTSYITNIQTSATNSSKVKFYAFEEIINRKDLLPLYVITINSTSATNYTLTAVKDIRKFVANIENKSNLVLYNSDNNYSNVPIGNFSTWEAVCNYINLSPIAINNTIIVKGTISINSRIQFTKPVHIIGDAGNIVNVITVGSGLTLPSNSIIENVNFNRTFEIGVSPIRYTQNYGTLICALSGSSNISNIKFDNCTFDSNSTSTSNVGHIVIQHSGDGCVVQNITITNNTFKETSGQLCVAIVNINGADLTVSVKDIPGMILNNITISNNVGYTGSKLLISSDNQDKLSAGIIGHGIKITENNFDYLLCNIGEFEYSSQSLRDQFSNTGTIITNNTCIGLKNTDLGYIESVADTIKVGNCSYNISNNICSNITMVHTCNANGNSGKFNINNNIVKTYTKTITAYDNLVGIAVNGISLVGSDIVANIEGNMIGASAQTTQLYFIGIKTNVSANIHNNIIDKCFYEHYGIHVKTNNGEIVNITNNTIKRASNIILAYVYLSGQNSSNVVVTDNYFDSPTVDGSDSDLMLIENTNAKTLIARNKNQQYTIDMLPYIQYSKGDYVNGGTSYTGWDLEFNSFILTTTTDSHRLPAKVGSVFQVSSLSCHLPTLDNTAITPIKLTFMAQTDEDAKIELNNGAFVAAEFIDKYIFEAATEIVINFPNNFAANSILLINIYPKIQQVGSTDKLKLDLDEFFKIYSIHYTYRY